VHYYLEATQLSPDSPQLAGLPVSSANADGWQLKSINLHEVLEQHMAHVPEPTSSHSAGGFATLQVTTAYSCC